MNATIATETRIGGSLERLLRRFRAMVEVRRELAIGLRNRDDIASALPMEAKADAYESALRELERVIAGEIPPDAYEAWPESPNVPDQRPGKQPKP